MKESVLERLARVHPDLEIWWDSSPLVFTSWFKKMVDGSEVSRKNRLAEQLNRIYSVENPEKSLIRGCTTNPPLSLAAVKNDLPYWNNWIDNLINKNRGFNRYEYFLLTYKEIIRRGALMMLPIWKASKGRYGYISGQLDPRLLTETDQMIKQAREIRSIAPNVMIKVPASTQGVEVVKVLTSLAIPTNVTTCFTLPQIWAVAKAAKLGVKIALKNKVDMSRWRAVITMMIGRLTENPELETQAKAHNISLSWKDKHWLGIYIFRKAYNLLHENDMPSKMLACSMRDGPHLNGKYRFWDIEKIAGNIIYTMPPYVLDPLFNLCGGLTFREEILYEDVPTGVMHKLEKIPFARSAWDKDGMAVDRFNTHPSTVATSKAFRAASSGLEEYIGERMKIIKKTIRK